MRFPWNPPVLLHLCVVCGCFPATAQAGGLSCSPPGPSQKRAALRETRLQGGAQLQVLFEGRIPASSLCFVGYGEAPTAAKTGAGLGPFVLPGWGLPTQVCSPSAIRVRFPGGSVAVGQSGVKITRDAHSLKLPGPEVLTKGAEGSGGRGFREPWLTCPLGAPRLFH